MNLNPIFNSVANEQGIEPNSSLWNSAGLNAYSGQTGGHGAYGWKHSHKLSEAYAKAAIANYAHRRCYYENEPFRQGGYLVGGRPLGWKPEDAQDLPSGEVTYWTSKGIVKVSGPDATHFHIGPLIEVFDADAYQVQVFGQKMPAKFVAGEIVKHLMTTLIGIQAKPNGDYHNYGDRGTANVLKALAQAAKRGLIFPEDQVRFYDWIKKFFIPNFLKSPGHNYSHKEAFSNPPKYVFQLYNGLYWTLPGAFDVLSVAINLQLTELIPDLQKIVIRKCNWMKSIFEHAGTFNLTNVEVDKSIENLVEAPLDLKPYIKSVENGSWEKWGFRAISVAAFVLKDESLEVELAKIRAKYPASIDPEWFVDYKLDYV